MGGAHLIALAIPFFFLLIGVELLVARAKRRRLYRVSDALVDLSCGVTQQVLGLFYGALLVAGYAWLYDHHALLRFPSTSAWPWLVAFVGVDFLYYWWHRLSHEVNVLWAAHVVHHSSEDYNLAVALRQAVLTDFTAWPFYAPLALLGVPPLVFVAMHSLSTLYQFWIHTQLVGKLGPLEWIINTPMQHRVHHAINPRYLDKNYGAILCVWDRLFGTYVEETEPSVYGLVRPLASFSPLWAQLHHWVEMARLARKASSVGDKLRVWFASPAWKPANLPNPPAPSVSPETYSKYDPPVGSAMAGYVVAQFALVVGGTFSLLWWQGRMPREAAAVGAALVLLTLLATGGLLERRAWARAIECARLGLVVAAVGLGASRLGLPVAPVGAAAAVAAIASGAWLLRGWRPAKTATAAVRATAA